MPNFLYHYTAGHKIPLILQSGFIATTPKAPQAGEAPMAWLSSNPDWEPTSAKLGGPDHNNLRLLSKADMHEHLGLFRFKFHHYDMYKSTYAFQDMVKMGLMPEALHQKLTHNGLAMGGNPSDWYGVPHQIFLTGNQAVRFGLEELVNNGQGQLVWQDVRA